MDLLEMIQRNASWVSTACTAALAGLVLYLQQRFASKPDLAALATKIATEAQRREELDRRCALIEERLRHMPDKDDIAQVQVAMGHLTGQVNAMSMAVSTAVERLETLTTHMLRRSNERK